MACLLDTGILLRAFDPSFSEHRRIRQAFRLFLTRQESVVVTTQNLAEFWNVSTRPVDKNGFGLSVERAKRRLEVIERFCQVVTEDQDSYRIWKKLIVAHGLTGVGVHDARLVAIMQSRGISTIVTLNERDFRRYEGITVLTPQTL
jgi:predicted nucleic acid-binding protein